MSRVGRALATVLVSAAVLAGLGGAFPPAALAHPLGNFTSNRYSGIVLSPGKLRVDYVLDLAEIPAFQVRPNVDADRDGVESEAERRSYAIAEAATLRRGLVLRVDGRAVPLSPVAASLRFLPGQAGLPTLRLEAVFEAHLPASGGALYRDTNLPGRIGWKEITVRSEAGVTISRSTAPAVSVSRELTAYPSDLLSDPLHVTSVEFTFGPGSGSGTAGNPKGPPVRNVPVASGGAFAGLVDWRLTPLALAASLLLAFVFGAVHAIGPGHGKTITAAYLVGSGARLGQAVALGATVAAMHTTSVLTLGAVLLVLVRTFPSELVYPWLTAIIGLVAVGLGVALFVTRIRSGALGRRPHGHDHVHEGDPQHDHVHSRAGLAALAVAGGIIPSPTAFVVLAGAISAHRVAYGLGLIVAFSLGLAAALTLVGLVALRARAVIAGRLGGRFAALMPAISALVIVGFGVLFSARGLIQLA